LAQPHGYELRFAELTAQQRACVGELAYASLAALELRSEDVDLLLLKHGHQGWHSASASCARMQRWHSRGNNRGGGGNIARTSATLFSTLGMIMGGSSLRRFEYRALLHSTH